MALDFLSNKGVATAIGHAPGAALVDPAAGSKLAIAEALDQYRLGAAYAWPKGVSLSANWMWPSKNRGEDARLYQRCRSRKRVCHSIWELIFRQEKIPCR